jgi:hypothetical protein
MDDTEPKISRFKLKPREVESSEPLSRPGDGTEISVALIHRQNQLAAERHAAEVPQETSVDGTEEEVRSGAVDPFLPKDAGLEEERAESSEGLAISIKEFLKENREAVRKYSPELIILRARGIPRQHRDFAIVVGIAALVLGPIAFAFRDDSRIVDLTIMCLVFVAALFAWIIYGIMDRY